MRIGILIQAAVPLRHWQLKVIDHIRRHPVTEIALVMKTRGRPDRAGGRSVARLAADRLLSLQMALESKLFKPATSLQASSLADYLEQLPQLLLSPVGKGGDGEYAETEIRSVGSYQLDLILQFDWDALPTSLSGAARYGLWTIQHSKFQVSGGSLPGFWEDVRKEAVIEAKLWQCDPDGVLSVIVESTYNRAWSCLKSGLLVEEEVGELLVQFLDRLAEGEVVNGKPADEPLLLVSGPTPGAVLKYLWAFYCRLGVRLLQRPLFQLLGIRRECWALFIGEGKFPDSDLRQLTLLPLPKGAFWADPFLHRHRGDYYVFFENLSYRTQRGKISCGKLEDGRLTGVQDVLDLDYHLSYPFLVEEDGALFMIPETSENRRLEVYRCVEFPYDWELYATAFEGEAVADATYFRDEHGRRWLFVNKGIRDFCSHLYIYRIDSLKLQKLESHRGNPVITDARVARNGGALFRHNGRLIRPSQQNARGVYGYGLNLNVVKKLSLEEYEEEPVARITPDFRPGLQATHHLHQLEEVFVIDACYAWK